MECKMIETGAYDELCSLLHRVCERVDYLASLCLPHKPDKWLTQEEVCKALHITKRGLQYFRQQGIVPYTAIGNKIFIKEADVQRLLAANMITPKK
ncbi:helix-turn-helix domain-containing protein [uncultured Alistipes sp.]|uniref:helix-turn-helix domain-containing protein n=1 Tax=uncultured Alistipes sp. TaxID=538949 RepID=UPI00321FD567